MYCWPTMNSSFSVQKSGLAPRPFEIADLEEYRRELLLASYQLLGSPSDAEDAVQETMIRAWRARDRYDPSLASIRTWLHRIAMNTSLTEITSRKRRPLPSTLTDPSHDAQAPLVPAFEVPWLMPIASSRFDGDDNDPEVQALRRGDVRLAFCAALQLLPPRQRAAIILCEVLDVPVAEVAVVLDSTVAAVNSLLQRARRTLSTNEGTQPCCGADIDESAVDKYVDAFMRGDVNGLTSMLAADAVLEMPPVPLWYVGVDLYAEFMARVFELRGTTWRTIRISANGQPGFAAFALTNGTFTLHTIQILTITNGSIGRNVVYQDPKAFAELALPATM